MKHIYSNIPENLPEELITVLCKNDSCKLERIVSKGHITPEGEWYDQDWNEWVIVLQGAAKLQFENEAEEVSLNAGDYLEIPAHKKHRVSWTDPDLETVWLALHYK